MGEYADAMLNGDVCESCGEELGCGDGYTRLCQSCRVDNDKPSRPTKTKCDLCNKMVKKTGLAMHKKDKHGIAIYKDMLL